MAAPFIDLAVPRSILDTDLYKFTMQQAVLHYFPHTYATYRFKNRNSSTLFSRFAAERFKAAVAEFTNLKLTSSEQEWLHKTCPYLKSEYIAYLSTYRYKPEQARITFVPLTEDGLWGDIEIEVSGPWVETICWEVPLMACLSETYFQTVATDWDYVGQEEAALNKGIALLTAGCAFSEFGTRRRRSYHAQDIVIQSLIEASQIVPEKGKLVGTSNVHFAQKYELMPIGTIAHEWFMGVAALEGYEHANATALGLWESLYDNTTLVALTDTFSTGVFFKEFSLNVERVIRWAGLRQDSGDPFTFAPRVIAMYESVGVDFRQKQIVFSDSLDIDKCIQLHKQCEELGLRKASFGIGTFLTNDFRTLSSDRKEKSKALNIVIKLASVDGKPCIKLSDDLSKTTGDQATVERIKKIHGLAGDS